MELAASPDVALCAAYAFAGNVPGMARRPSAAGIVLGLVALIILCHSDVAGRPFDSLGRESENQAFSNQTPNESELARIVKLARKIPDDKFRLAQCELKRLRGVRGECDVTPVAGDNCRVRGGFEARDDP